MRAISSFLVVLLAVGIIGQQNNTRVFEDTIISITECIRQLLIDGVPESDVPSFDPLELDEAYTDLSAFGVFGLEGYTRVTNIFLDGVTDFEQINVSGQIGLIPPSYTVAFVLVFGELTLNTGYDLAVVYTPQNVNIYGEGTLAFEALDLALDISVTVTILGGVELADVRLWPSLGGLNSLTITGLYNDEDYSAALTEEILENPSAFVARYAPIVNAIAYDIAMDAVNNGDDVGDSDLINAIIDRCT